MSRLSRREALRRVAYLSAATGLPFSFTAASGMPIEPWATVDLPQIDAPGYGTDPDLINPAVPWPRTLTSAQRALVEVLADILIPQEGDVPSATGVGVSVP